MEKIIYHPEASLELNEILEFYELQKIGLGEKFLNCLEGYLNLILRYPHMGNVIQKKIRRCFVYQFPYSIIYSVESESIYIIAVAHTSRRPLYWKSRKAK